MVSDDDKKNAAKDVIRLCDAIEDDNRLVIACCLIIKTSVRDNPALSHLLMEKAKEIDDAIDLDLAEALNVQC